MPRQSPGEWVGPSASPWRTRARGSRPVLTRTTLNARLDGAFARALTTVVAAPGFGKSTTLADWATGRRVAWHAIGPLDAAPAHLLSSLIGAIAARVPGLPPELASAAVGALGPDAEADEDERAQAGGLLVCAALEDRLTRDLVLVVDDCHRLSPVSARLIETICRGAPRRLHLIIASRSQVPFSTVRLQSHGQAAEITAADLAFDVAEVMELLQRELGDPAGELADALYRVTGGWPAVVRMGVEALRSCDPARRAGMIDELDGTAGAVVSYLLEEVLTAEPDAVREFLQTVLPFERINADLCTALGVADADATLAAQGRRGLFVEVDSVGSGWFSLNTLLRGALERRRPRDDARSEELHRRAAAWFGEHGHFGEAARSLAAIGDASALAGLIEDRGAGLLTGGRADELARAVELLPATHHTVRVEALYGQAHQMLGRWDHALACFERVGRSDMPLDAGSAWRMGLIHHLRGDLETALQVYRTAGTDGDAREEAILCSWRAGAEWMRGEADACAADAHRALVHAQLCGDDGAFAAAHTALALSAALAGDRAANDAHYVRALDFAVRAGDVTQEIRIRTNVGSRLLEEGHAAEALSELNRAVSLAEVAGFSALRALALSNRGWAQFQLGRLEEAIADLEVAKYRYQRMGSSMVSYALGLLGTVHRERGDRATARAAFEEAVILSEQSRDLQGLVPALAGLAVLLAHDEPEEAAALADRAVRAGSAMGEVEGLLASGWVALARGDRVAAAESGRRSAAAAGGRRDQPGLAEALELLAIAERSLPEAALERLDEAIGIWRDLGYPINRARAELTRANLVGAREDEAAIAARMRLMGARGTLSARVRLLTAAQPVAGYPAVMITCLGGFQVLRAGVPVPLAEWQSKKARDVLKLLVVKRGCPTPRESLAEILWPDADPGLLGNRLSVVLATVRSVLDPAKVFPADHYVVGDRGTVRLNLDTVVVDVEDFLRDATAGLARGADAAELVRLAEVAYAGDFLEEDPFEDWAVALREEARAVYMRVLRRLADAAVDGGDHQLAVRYLLRILERDPYDEGAHLDLARILTTARRHGEARRAYGIYLARMQEIDIEPAAFPVPDDGPS